MLQMTRLMEISATLSKSFAELATLHQGADKSEIQMMQRMSDSMGILAGEVKTTLQQYSKMLHDETTSESKPVRAEVDNLADLMTVIADQISEAVQTLQKLDAQLGQG
jgi:phage-related tail protein